MLLSVEKTILHNMGQAALKLFDADLEFLECETRKEEANEKFFVRHNLPLKEETNRYGEIVEILKNHDQAKMIFPRFQPGLSAWLDVNGNVPGGKNYYYENGVRKFKILQPHHCHEPHRLGKRAARGRDCSIGSSEIEQKYDIAARDGIKNGDDLYKLFEEKVEHTSAFRNFAKTTEYKNALYKKRCKSYRTTLVNDVLMETFSDHCKSRFEIYDRENLLTQFTEDYPHCLQQTNVLYTNLENFDAACTDEVQKKMESNPEFSIFKDKHSSKLENFCTNMKLKMGGAKNSTQALIDKNKVDQPNHVCIVDETFYEAFKQYPASANEAEKERLTNAYNITGPNAPLYPPQDLTKLAYPPEFMKMPRCNRVRVGETICEGNTLCDIPATANIVKDLYMCFIQKHTLNQDKTCKDLLPDPKNFLGIPNGVRSKNGKEMTLDCTEHNFTDDCRLEKYQYKFSTTPFCSNKKFTVCQTIEE